MISCLLPRAQTVLLVLLNEFSVIVCTFMPVPCISGSDCLHPGGSYAVLCKRTDIPM